MVIARKKIQFDEFVEVFNEAGIPFVKYKDMSLFTGIECAHWIALISAILKPDFTKNNRKAFRKALYTKFFGLSLEEIASSDFDRDDSDEMQLILKWKALAQNYKYNELVDSILTDSNLNQNLGNINDVQRYNVFRQIGDYAISYLLAGNNLSSLKNKLISLSNKETDDELNGTIVAKGTDFESVEIMTIHASKGLDRPIVIVAGEDKNKKGNQSNVYVIHDNGKSYLSMNNESKIYGSKIKYFEEAERERLFYVAYTRAKNLMILQYYSTDSLISDFFKNYSNCYELIDVSNKPKLNYQTNPNGIISNDIVKKEQEDKLKNISKTINKHNVYKHSYASMSKGVFESKLVYDSLNEDKEGIELLGGLNDIDTKAKVINLKYDQTENEEIPSNFAKGKEVGTTLHEVFEKFEFKNILNKDKLNETIKECFNSNMLQLDSKQLKYVSNIVYNTLNANLPIIEGNKEVEGYFNLKEIESDCRKAEMEFNFSNLDNGIFSNYYNGFIDLIIKRGEYYSVLDWKSDTLNDTDLLSYNKLENLKQRVDSHYAVQRVLYSYCLVKWLYDLGIEKSLDEVFDKHFGGIYYVFIRGCKEKTCNGIYAQTWQSWSDLEKAFKDMIKITKDGGTR